jgi:hypothetical protein
VNGRTFFTRRVRYSSKKDRDADFDAVATSAEETYARLEHDLASKYHPADAKADAGCLQRSRKW